MFFGGDPFEHFAHHGGGGSGRSHRSAAAASNRDVDTTKLYETLGVSTAIMPVHVMQVCERLRATHTHTQPFRSLFHSTN